MFFGPDSTAFVLQEKPSDATSGPQKTLAIIQPDLVQAGKSEEIIEKILCRGFQISAREEFQLTHDAATELYSIYKEDPSFNDLIQYVTR